MRALTLLALIDSAHGYSFAASRPLPQCPPHNMEQMSYLINHRLLGRPPSLAVANRGRMAAPLLSSTAVAAPAAEDVITQSQTPDVITNCRYDHLQFFVDNLKPLSHYKAVEARLNEFAERVPRTNGLPVDVAAAREVWCQMGGAADPEAFEVHGRDLVEQMLCGFGWRITGQHEGDETRSLLLSTVDPSGARFIITCNRAAAPAAATPSPEPAGAPETEAAKPIKTAQTFDHFARSNLARYFSYHNGAQGIGVLGFELEAGGLAVLQRRYEALHPKLIAGPVHSYADGTRVLDVFAYYRGDEAAEADTGTILRFVERSAAAHEGGEGGEGGAASLPLPGLVPVAADFEAGVLPAYCDHWVSEHQSSFHAHLHFFTPISTFSTTSIIASTSPPPGAGEQRRFARRLPADARGHARLPARAAPA